MNVQQTHKVTLKEYQTMPEGFRAEFFEGQMVMEHAAPLYGHQEISSILHGEIYLLIKSKKLFGKILSAAMDVYLEDDLVVQPDLIFIKKENLAIIKDHIHGVPDMLIEILSPSTMSYDMITKYKWYEEAGVQEYFIINPDDKLVICYRLQNKSYNEAYRDVGFLKSEVMGAEIIF